MPEAGVGRQASLPELARLEGVTFLLFRWRRPGILCYRQ